MNEDTQITREDQLKLESLRFAVGGFEKKDSDKIVKDAEKYYKFLTETKE